MIELRFDGSVKGLRIKNVINTLSLPKEDKICIITRCPKDKADVYAILNPNDTINFSPCKWYKPISAKGRYLWTGKMFVKA